MLDASIPTGEKPNTPIKKTATIPTDGYSQESIRALELTISELVNNKDAVFSKYGLKLDVNQRMLSISELKNGNVVTRPAEQEERKELITSINIFGTKTIPLGSGLCYEQTKLEDWSFYCRTCCMEGVAVFSHPELDTIWSDVVDCAFSAAGVATLAAILASPAVALPVFKASFYTCLVAKGKTWATAISVDLRVQESIGQWRPCL
jgi:hypothetical protein